MKLKPFSAETTTGTIMNIIILIIWFYGLFNNSFTIMYHAVLYYLAVLGYRILYYTFEILEKNKNKRIKE